MRLFVAIDIGEKVQDALSRAIEDLRSCAPDAKWVTHRNVHVTLVFIGEVAEARVPPLVEALDAAAAKHRSHTLRVEGGGAFGRSRHPKVIWAALKGETQELAGLQQSIEDAVDLLGHPVEERDFHPHVTVARSRDFRGDAPLAQCVERLNTLQFGTTEITEVLLMKSTPGPNGSVYEVLHRAKLRPQ